MREREREREGGHWKEKEGGRPSKQALLYLNTSCLLYCRLTDASQDRDLVFLFTDRLLYGGIRHTFTI